MRLEGVKRGKGIFRWLFPVMALRIGTRGAGRGPHPDVPAGELRPGLQRLDPAGDAGAVALERLGAELFASFTSRCNACVF